MLYLLCLLLVILFTVIIAVHLHFEKRIVVIYMSVILSGMSDEKIKEHVRFFYCKNRYLLVFKTLFDFDLRYNKIINTLNNSIKDDIKIYKNKIKSNSYNEFKKSCIEYIDKGNKRNITKRQLEDVVDNMKI